MSRVIIPALTLLLASALLISAYADQKLTAAEAKQHIGEIATVCGVVADARYAEKTKGSPTFLNLDKAYPNAIFTAVIWGSDRAKFGKPEVEFKGKRICVTGKIEEYRGAPEMALTDPKQITKE